MPSYKAVVQSGRIVIDNVDYEDGTEIELEVVNDNEGDEMDDDPKLVGRLDHSLAQAKAGNSRLAKEVIAERRARGK